MSNPSPKSTRVRVNASLQGEEEAAFEAYLKINNLKSSAGAKALIVSGLVKDGYLPVWWLENSLGRQAKSGWYRD